MAKQAVRNIKKIFKKDPYDMKPKNMAYGLG